MRRRGSSRAPGLRRYLPRPPSDRAGAEPLSIRRTYTRRGGCTGSRSAARVGAPEPGAATQYLIACALGLYRSGDADRQSTPARTRTICVRWPADTLTCLIRARPDELHAASAESRWPQSMRCQSIGCLLFLSFHTIMAWGVDGMAWQTGAADVGGTANYGRLFDCKCLGWDGT